MLKLILLLVILPIILISVFNIESYGQIYSHSPDLDVVISYSEVNDTTQINLIFSEINIHYEIFIIQNGEIILQETGYSMKLTTNYTVNAIGSHKKPIDINVIPFGIDYYNSDSSSLTITTNKPSYLQGENISITGQIPSTYNSQLTISLNSPTHGLLDTMYNVTTNNNTYSKTIPTGNNTTIHTTGSYTLTANYGTNTASTTFDYSSTPTQQDNEYFIPDSSYLTLSDHEIDKWNRELLKWQNAQNRTDSKIEFYYEKLDTAMIRNQTDKIELYTERIGHSMALSELYDGLIECLQEQLEILS